MADTSEEDVDVTNSTELVEHMLTTVDNPFDPFTQFDEWLAYDIKLGYNTSSFLDRIARVSNDSSEADQALAIEQAMDEIVQENVLGLWKKVSKNSVKTS